MAAIHRLSDSWRAGLDEAKDGGLKRNLRNTMAILARHPAWVGVIAWDDFTLQVVKRKRAPSNAGYCADEESALGQWTAEDTTNARVWMQSETGIEPNEGMVEQAVSAIAKAHRYHPVREWLRSLRWDGTERLDTLCAKYFGADDTIYAAAVGSKWLISAVARVMHPGCKVDTMTVFEGLQGAGKSSGLQALVGADWFSDSKLEIGDKDGYQNLRGKLVIEIAELASFGGRQQESIKAYTSSQSDTYRPSYGRHTVTVKRQTIFAGTTNADTYLGDSTGARRFWPVRCRQVDVGGLRADREQLWAEAVQRFDAGASWWLDDAETIREAVEQQELRQEQDPWLSLIQSSLERAPVELTTDWILSSVLDLSPSERNHGHIIRIGKCLKQLGFTHTQLRSGPKRGQRIYTGTVPATVPIGQVNLPLGTVEQ